MASKKGNGRKFENRVARVQFGAGSFTRLRVPVRAPATQGRKILTDIDVVALDLDFRLRPSLTILECKSGGGESGEPDRLFWLAGFSRYIHADRAVLVRTSVSSRGRELARRLDLETFDEPTLAKREESIAWMPEVFAHVGGMACNEAEIAAVETLKKLGGVPDEVAYLRDAAFLAPPHRSLGAVAGLRSILSKTGALPGVVGVVVAGHGLIANLYAALRLAGELDATPLTEVRRRLDVGWMTGDPADTQVIDVLDAADLLFAHQANVIHDAYVAEGAKKIRVSIPSAAESILEKPEWGDRLMALAERLRANPTVARELPQTVEIAVFDALLGDSNWKADAFDGLFSLEHKQLIVATLKVFESVAGEAAAAYLAPMADLPFDRSTPRLSERLSPYHGDADAGTDESSDVQEPQEALFNSD